MQTYSILHIARDVFVECAHVVRSLFVVVRSCWLYVVRLFVCMFVGWLVAVLVVGIFVCCLWCCRSLLCLYACDWLFGWLLCLFVGLLFAVCLVVVCSCLDVAIGWWVGQLLAAGVVVLLLVPSSPAKPQLKTTTSVHFVRSLDNNLTRELKHNKTRVSGATLLCLFICTTCTPNDWSIFIVNLSTCCCAWNEKCINAWADARHVVNCK